MSATVVIVIDDANGTIAQLNEKLQNNNPGDSSRLINAAIDYLARAAMGGVAASTVQLIVRDTDPSVSTSGSGSTSVTVSVG